jgi:Tol biopolymer transport system component
MRIKRLAMLSLLAIGFLLSSVNWVAMSASWLTMESPHFRVTFEEGQESQARQAIYYLELSNAKLSAELGHEPKDKTEVLLADMSDSPNGVATPYWGYNKEYFLMVYGAPNSTLRNGIDTWLYTLAAHEYTHTLHIDMAEGFAGTMKAIFGRSGGPNYLFLPSVTTPNGELPQYLIEGFAAYLETINTTGGRLRSSLWEMMMRADFAHNRVMTRDQASGIYSYSRFTGDVPRYLYGAYFCYYIARIYGQDKLMEIMKQNANSIPLFINGSFRKVLKKSLPEVWQEFTAEAATTYAAQIKDIQSKSVTEATRLTTTTEEARNPVYSPDGSKIAYMQGGQKRLSALRIVSADGSKNEYLITTDPISAAMGDSFSWSSDGTKLLYSSFDDVGRQLLSDIYIYDFKREEKKRLTNGLRAYAPSYSPDGKTIVFIAHTGAMETSLMAMDVDGTNVRTLLKGVAEMQFNSAHFSPDGKQITLSVGSYGGFSDIYVVDADGKNLTALTQDKEQDFSPQWSPDGKYILFNSDRSGVPNLYAIQLSDGKLFQITNVLFGAFSPTMSPDGKKIVYVNYDIDGYDLYQIDADPSTWKSVAAEQAVLPTPPDYASFAKDFTIRPYSAMQTLFPKLWVPLMAQTYGGALVRSQDLLGRTTFSALATISDTGNPYGEVDITQALTGESVTSSEPAPATLSLSLTPQYISGGLSIPLEDRLYSSRSVEINGKWGFLGMAGTGADATPIEGLGVSLSWLSSSSGGHDRVRTYVNGETGAFATLSGGAVAWGLSTTRSLTFLIDGDLRLFFQTKVDTSDLSMRGYSDVSFTLAFVEQELGTWPIYFERIKLEGFAGGSIDLSGQYGYYFGANLIIPTYLWYTNEIDPSIGFVIDANGNLQTTFSLGF